MSLVCYILVIVCSLNGVWSDSVSGGELSVLESSINAEGCEFYATLEKTIKCGENGYALNFGYPKCIAYLNERAEFIQKEWQDGVRACLQRELLFKLRQSSGGSCDDIKNWGFGSHTGCYRRPISDKPYITFCNLPAADMRKIVWIAKGSVFEGAMWVQGGQLSMDCAGKYMQDIHEDAGNYIRKLRAEIKEKLGDIASEIGISLAELTVEHVKRWLLNNFNGDNTHFYLE